jgi:hypothetical protein
MVSSETEKKMEIVLVWNNSQSFQQHVADMKNFSENHKKNPANEFPMLKDMPLPGSFQPVLNHGGGKIQLSPRRKSTLVPLWEVELPEGIQN